MGKQHGNRKQEQPIWPVVLVTVIVGYAFYAGIWMGIFSLVIGSIVLGWGRRHDGPISTSKGEE